MAIYTYKRCPHCGKMYDSYSNHTKYWRKRVGSPLRTCSSCGKPFLDNDMEELALQPYNERGYGIFHCFFAFFWPFGAAAAMFTWLAIDLGQEKPWVIIVAIILHLAYWALTISVIKNRKKFIEEHKRDYEASEKRLQDQEYALLLRKAGYYVPERFLPNIQTEKQKPIPLNFDCKSIKASKTTSHGKCQNCAKPNVERTKCAIKIDKLGTKERFLCNECIEKYQAASQQK